MVIDVLFNLAMMVLDALSVFFTGGRRFGFRPTVVSKTGGCPYRRATAFASCAAALGERCSNRCSAHQKLQRCIKEQDGFSGKEKAAKLIVGLLKKAVG